MNAGTGACMVPIYPELAAQAKSWPGSKWTARHAGILDHVSFLTVEIFRKKKVSFLWKCEDILKNLGFSVVSELMVSTPIPYKTFHFTTVLHLSFKSLLNSCAK